jgi:uncharacterized protein YndB with AHSA1/START domain
METSNLMAKGASSTLFPSSVRCGQPPWLRVGSRQSLLALTAIITFAAEGHGTRYSAYVMHKNAADSRKHEELGFEQGWGTTINQLAAFVQHLE